MRPIKTQIAITVTLVTMTCAALLHAGPVPAPASFGYVLQAESLSQTKAGAVQKLASSKRDWIVLDANYSNSNAWTPQDLATIRRAQSGRKVIAYLSIGEAESYRPYWHSDWTSGGKLTTSAPAWLLPENPDWPGNYRVKYWDPAWQSIMLSRVDAVMSSGFDGVYLDIVDGFEYFEKEGNDFVDDRPNSETGNTYRQDMVAWVKKIAAAARRKNAAAMVIPQNGAQLLAHADYRDVINAIGIEDLFTDGNKLQPKSSVGYNLSLLKNLADKTKPVLLIEYPTKSDRKDFVKKEAAQRGFIWLLTDRQLKTLGVSGR